MKGTLVNILKYRDCDKSREELIEMFNGMKTTSKEPDRFHYIRCWNGALEIDPVVLTAGLVQVPADQSTPNDASGGEVLPATGSQLQ